MKRIATDTLRSNLRATLKKVQREPYIITRRWEEVAVLMSMREYEKLKEQK